MNDARSEQRVELLYHPDILRSILEANSNKLMAKTLKRLGVKSSGKKEELLERLSNCLSTRQGKEIAETKKISKDTLRSLYSEADDRLKIAEQGGDPIHFPRFVTFNKNYEEPIPGMNQIRRFREEEFASIGYLATDTLPPNPALQVPKTPQNIPQIPQNMNFSPLPTQIHPILPQTLHAPFQNPSTNPHKRQKITESSPPRPLEPRQASLPKQIEQMSYKKEFVPKNLEEEKQQLERVTQHDHSANITPLTTKGVGHIPKEKLEKIKKLELQEESKIYDPYLDTGSLAVQKSVFKEHKVLMQESKDIKVHCWCKDTKIGGRGMILCIKCGKYQHIDCIDTMAQVKPYICFHCQFIIMDLLSVPADIICYPVRLGVVDRKTIKLEHNPKISELLMTEKGKYRVEIRGLRLSEIPFKNSWPNYGKLDIDDKVWTHLLSLPEREQSRKRKDEPLDLTSLFKTRNKKDHELHLRKDKTPLNHDKNHDANCYVIGMFLCQKLEIDQVIDYHKKYELNSFLTTFNMIYERLYPKDKGDEITVICDQLEIPMTCPITLKPVLLPARGYKCTHVECFDLVNFLKTNTRFRTFKCPICNKNANISKIDPFLLSLRQFLEKTGNCKEISSVVIKNTFEIIMEGLKIPLNVNGLIDFYIEQRTSNNGRLFEEDEVIYRNSPSEETTNEGINLAKNNQKKQEIEEVICID
ncbi:unnamed protein product [Moneuplotes crassus]|uniref:SP-RING-type domain-containing protein n=1 Tax=Euplotes crassus TaxID=5936 RepID=A0AAD1U0J7_EUPCR|nr:unnamed protein product [Moneuplotes crassus]